MLEQRADRASRLTRRAARREQHAWLQHQGTCKLEQLPLATQTVSPRSPAPWRRARRPRGARGRARERPLRSRPGRPGTARARGARPDWGGEQHVVHAPHDRQGLRRALECVRTIPRRANPCGARPDQLAVERDVASVAALEPCHHVEERRLSGAVGTDQRGDRAARRPRTSPVDREHTREPLGHAHLEQRRVTADRRISSSRLPKSPAAERRRAPSGPPRRSSTAAQPSGSESGSSRYRVASSMKMRKNDPRRPPGSSRGHRGSR